MRRALSVIAGATAVTALGASTAIANPGDLYVGNPGLEDVVRINVKTHHQSVVAEGGDLSSPDSGAFDAKGRLVIADYSAFGGIGAIFRINAGTGAVQTLAQSAQFLGPTDVAISPGGGIFAVDPSASSGGAVFKISNGSATIVSDGQLFSGGPLGLAFTPGGKLFTSDQAAGPGGSGALIRVNQSNGDQSFASHGHKLDGPYGMALSPSGKTAYLANDSDARSIVRVNLKTGAEKVVSQGKPLNGPTDVAFGLDGNLYVANNGSNVGAIIRVNPKTGHAHVFARGGKLDAPEGITIEPR